MFSVASKQIYPGKLANYLWKAAIHVKIYFAQSQSNFDFRQKKAVSAFKTCV